MSLMECRGLSRKLPYSDIDLSRWRDYDNILTDSLWILKSRKKTDGHKLDYHGNFIPQIAEQVMLRYTKTDEIVVDWFLGSGTSAIEALNLSRRLIGVELKPELVEYVSQKLPTDVIGSRIKLIQGDSSAESTLASVRQALREMGSEYAQLAILHPPYADIIKFSELDADLSNCPDTCTFLQKFAAVACSAYETLEPGRFAILVIGDKYCNGELDPLGFRCMNEMINAGFRVKSIVVKNIEGNEIAKGKSNNLWRYRALANGFYVFKHEYVMIFFKPQSQASPKAESKQRT
jgi:DNA modification methylase